MKKFTLIYFIISFFILASCKTASHCDAYSLHDEELDILKSHTPEMSKYVTSTVIK